MKKQLPETINKILLVQLAGIGDLVMATPAINAIRGRFPDANIVLLTTEKARGLLSNSKIVNEIFSLDYSGRFQIDLLFNKKIWHVITKLRKRRFDLAVNLYQIYSFRGALQLWLLFKLINVKFIIGRDTGKRGFFLSLKITERPDREEHEVESNLLLAELLGAKAQNKNLHLDINGEDENFITRFLYDRGISDNNFLIGINPGSAWRLTRRWLPQRFAETADKIIERYSAKIVITGSASEQRLSAEILSFMKNKPIDATGKLSISQLAALIKRCNLYISTDSGPMHIAVAVATPLVAIFGPGHLRYHPYGDSDKFIVVKKDTACSPCYRIKCDNQICMKAITVDDVLKAVENQLKKSGLI